MCQLDFRQIWTLHALSEEPTDERQKITQSAVRYEQGQSRIWPVSSKLINLTGLPDWIFGYPRNYVSAM